MADTPVLRPAPAAAPTDPSAEPAIPRSFAALRHPDYRLYFVTTALAMMADNIEHVISYWVLFENSTRLRWAALPC